MKKKLLVIGPGMEIGGVETSLIGLLDSIDYSQYDVDLFLMAHTGELMPMINKNVNLLSEEPKYALINWPIAKLFASNHIYMGLIRLYSRIAGTLRAKFTHRGNVNTSLCRKIMTKHVAALTKNYDVALGFFGPHYFLNEKVSANIKMGWVHTDYTAEHENYDASFCEDMWKSLDIIACVSESVKKSFDSIYPQFESKTIVAENILSYEFVKHRAEEFVPENEMPDDGLFKILSVGRFSTPKNFDSAIRACRKLADDKINFKWYFIGYGPDEQMLQSLIRELGVEKCAIILGKKINPYPYMKRCDLYVQPSRYEGKAVAVSEAQMLGKPVLITRYDTSTSQLCEGIDGHICDLSIEGIVAGIKQLINNPVLMEKYHTNCLNTNYSNSDVFNNLIHFLEK